MRTHARTPPPLCCIWLHPEARLYRARFHNEGATRS